MENIHSILNFEAIYYWIYIESKLFFNFLLPKDAESYFDILTIWSHSADSSYILDSEKFLRFGEGIAAKNNGYSLFDSSNFMNTFFNNPYCIDCSSFFDFFFGGWNAYLYFFCIFIFLLILIIKIKQNFLTDKEKILYDTVYVKEESGYKNIEEEKWEKIINLLDSLNKNDWKAAIIDADNFLEKVLEKKGFAGENMGEKLRNANFSTLQNAWDAHRVRNQIAHNSDYNLTHREAKFAIANFERVLNELYI